MAKRILTSDKLTRPVGVFSQATMVTTPGKLIFVSGLTSREQGGGDFDAIHAVRREFFPQDPPASTMVEVTRLVDERVLLEIEATAVVEG